MITTETAAEVFVELSGRTVFDEAGGRQLVFATFESQEPAYPWLNPVTCIGEGGIDPGTLEARIETSLCEPLPRAVRAWRSAPDLRGCGGPPSCPPRAHGGARR